MTTYVIDDAIGGAVVPGTHDRIDASSETRSRPETRREQRRQSNVDQVLDDSFPASDPPSWTGAISRVASAPDVNEGLVGRIRAEFLEMPGLCLTMPQAQRLWCLEPRACEALLETLIDARFLRRTDRGLFVLSTPLG